MADLLLICDKNSFLPLLLSKNEFEFDIIDEFIFQEETEERLNNKFYETVIFSDYIENTDDIYQDNLKRFASISRLREHFNKLIKISTPFIYSDGIKIRNEKNIIMECPADDLGIYEWTVNNYINTRDNFYNLILSECLYKNSYIYNLIKQISQNETFELEQNEIISIISEDDFAKILKIFIETDNFKNKTYNISQDTPISISSIMNYVSDKLNKKRINCNKSDIINKFCYPNNLKSEFNFEFTKIERVLDDIIKSI